MVCHVPVVMQSPLDWVMHPETMLQIISEHKCTLAWLPNFAFQFVPRRTPQQRHGDSGVLVEPPPRNSLTPRLTPRDSLTYSQTP